MRWLNWFAVEEALTGGAMCRLEKGLRMSCVLCVCSCNSKCTQICTKRQRNCARWTILRCSAADLHIMLNIGWQLKKRLIIISRIIFRRRSTVPGCVDSNIVVCGPQQLVILRFQSWPCPARKWYKGSVHGVSPEQQMTHRWDTTDSTPHTLKMQEDCKRCSQLQEMQ